MISGTEHLHTRISTDTQLRLWIFKLKNICLPWIVYDIFCRFCEVQFHFVKFSQTAFAISQPPKIVFWWCKNNFYYQIIIKLIPVPVWVELGPVQPQLVFKYIFPNVSHQITLSRKVCHHYEKNIKIYIIQLNVFFFLQLFFEVQKIVSDNSI